jgi:dTMP kinase
MNGKFIVLEGLDGAGTTTQLTLLSSYLLNKGKEFVTLCTREPTMLTREGREIRNILRQGVDWKKQHDEKYMASLFVKDRRWHVDNLVIPNKNIGVQVISDRHMLSTLAYQSLDGIPLDELVSMHEGITAPDLTIYLDVQACDAYNRITQNRTEPAERYEQETILIMVERAYKDAIEKVGRIQNITIINGYPEAETREEKIQKVALSVQIEVDKLYLN